MVARTRPGPGMLPKMLCACPKTRVEARMDMRHLWSDFSAEQLEEDNGVKAQSSVVIPASITLDSIDLDCDFTATSEEIEEYRNEQDHDKRINLVYQYQIAEKDLYPEDLQEILDDIKSAMDEYN